MDQPSPKIPAPAPNLPIDAGALPPSPARRAKLLTILIILPVIAVSLPVILVTFVFPKKIKHIDTSGLHENLDRVAQKQLPTPAALVEEPVRLTAPPAKLAARAERVALLAKSYGGQANEFLGGAGEKHLFVELPPGRGAAFRQSLLNGDGAPAAGTLAGTPAAGTKDQVEVFIHASQDE